MALAEGMSCVSCHAVHDAGVATGQLRAVPDELCVNCHNEQRAIIRHTPFHEQAATEYEFRCTDCHMPKMATSAVPFDLHNHSFLQPNPQASIDHGGVDAMPNACNLCHTDSGEDAQWAVQTIAYAESLATPSASVFFGPGPTPTSPPPPTPISSVGQPVERVEVQTGQWLRTTALGLAGVLALGVVVWVAALIRGRRLSNV
jgi:predicted CXXCH cytochrome family protein